MDSFFGIGIPELIVILLLAGLIMGPQRIRTVAYTIGRVTAQLQAVSRQFARQLNAELDGLEDETLQGAMQDMNELRREVETLRRELTAAPKSLLGEVEREIQETKAAIDPETAKQEANPVEEPPASEPIDNKKPTLPTAIEVPGDPE